MNRSVLKGIIVAVLLNEFLFWVQIRSLNVIRGVLTYDDEGCLTFALTYEFSVSHIDNLQ